MREFVCILLQSVSNEVFALLGILLTNMGIFCLNCSSNYGIKLNHHFTTTTTTTTTEKRKRKKRIIIERIVKVVSFIYTQNLRQQTTDAQIVHDL